MNLAVIPARGGSKRIPRKNIKEFCGRPIIAWSIRAALESGCFDRIVVSTDDSELAATAARYGADVPFLRPAHLSGDYVGTVPVIQHAVQWHVDNDKPFRNVCCLYATAPFVGPDDLRRGLDVLETQLSRYAVSITTYGYPIQRALRTTARGRIAMLHPENLNTRSQDLEEIFHDAGQFYWGRAEAWIAGEPLLAENSAPVVLPRHRVQDIDTEDDWLRAELMFKALNKIDSLRTSS